jgi:hypothetical protein
MEPIFPMSVSNALSYANQAKRASNSQDAFRLFERAFDELCRVVRDLEDRVSQLERDR